MDKSYNILLFGEEYNKTKFLLMCIPNDFKIVFLSLKEQYKVKIIVKGISGTDNINVRYNKDIKVIEVFTNKIPEFIQIYCKCNDDIRIDVQSIPIEKYDKFLIISSWQYEYAPVEFMLEKLEDIYSRNPILEIILILLESRIKTGATDLNTQDYVINKAYEKYKKVINTIILKEGDSLFKLFCPKIEIKTSLTIKYRQELDKWFSELNDKETGFLFDFLELKIVPEILDEYINLVNLDEEICGFETIKGSRNIVKAFWENFDSKDLKYYEKAESKIISYYKKFVEKICVWDLEQDFEIIKRDLKDLYELKKKKNMEKVYAAPKNLIEYNQLEEAEGVKLKFYESLTQYYRDDVPAYIVKHLNEKAQKIIKQLKEYNLGGTMNEQN